MILGPNNNDADEKLVSLTVDNLKVYRFSVN